MQPPDCISELTRMVREKKSHCFIVSGNIYDRILFGSKEWNSLEEFVGDISRATFDFYLQYNLFSGPKIINGDKAELLKLLGASQGNLTQEDRQLMQEAGINSDELPRESSELFSRLDKFFRENEKKMFFVLQYADAIFKGNEAGIDDPALEALKIALKGWARDRRIRENGHIILLLTRYKEDLDKSLFDRELGISQIRIPKPNLEERESFLEARKIAKKELLPAAKASAGLSLRSIEQIAKSAKGSVLEAIFNGKRSILEEEYGSLLKVVEPRWGFDCIGGLEKQKTFFREIAYNMQKGRYDLVPQGALLTGPPGTGKSILAEALAKELRVPLISPFNLRSKWVGDTERNLNRFEEAILDMMPLIVWIDEFDGFVIRQGDYDGSGGVERRFLEKVLIMMDSSNFHGRVLWLGASNRPDLISSNIKRPGRFTFRIPLLSPGATELAKIFPAILKQYPEIKTNVGSWEKIAEKIKGYTGADIKVMLKDFAWIKANRDGREVMTANDMQWAIEDYIPQRQGREEIDMMTWSAIKECSINSMLPDNWKEIIRDIKEKYDSQAPRQGAAPEDALAIALSRSNPNGINN